MFLFHTDIQDVLLFSALGGGVWGGLLMLIDFFAKTALGMALVSIVLLILRKVNKKTTVPMAPFVLLGFVICVFLGM